MTIEPPICFICKHYYNKATEWTCMAYPVKIPDEILWDDVGHDKPRADQHGNFVYEEKESQND